MQNGIFKLYNQQQKIHTYNKNLHTSIIIQRKQNKKKKNIYENIIEMNVNKCLNVCLSICR